MVLIDLWGKLKEPGSIYYDITWCGYIGDDPPEKYREIFHTVRDARIAAWRATVHNIEGARDAMVAWAKHGDGTRARGEHILAELLRHPERLTEQLVTLRAVQTLSLIDVPNYREHIFRLGGYEEAGDDPGHALSLA